MLMKTFRWGQWPQCPYQCKQVPVMNNFLFHCYLLYVASTFLLPIPILQFIKSLPCKVCRKWKAKYIKYKRQVQKGYQNVQKFVTGTTVILHITEICITSKDVTMNTLHILHRHCHYTCIWKEKSGHCSRLGLSYLIIIISTRPWQNWNQVHYVGCTASILLL